MILSASIFGIQRWISHYSIPLYILLFSASLPINASENVSFTDALRNIKDANLYKCLTNAQKKQQWTSISDVIKIKCHNHNIAQIEGIEQFSNLQELSLFNNNLTAFLLPNLANLRKLNLAKNPLSSLTLNHKDLQEVYVFSANLAHLSLDLPKAKMIRANNNLLVELNYGRLDNLEKLYLFNNQLPDMDITQLPALQFLDVRQNPMPDALYDKMDQLHGVTVFHDGNAEDWQ